MSENFDLFGDPVPENHGRRGRPAHVPTLRNRNKVSLLLAMGWSNGRIAAALSITSPTLREHYFSELGQRRVMRDRLNSRIAEKLFEGVNEGNVGAIKEFRKFLDHNDLMKAEKDFQEKTRTKPKKEPKRGKKEIAAQEAQTGHEGTGWSNLLQ